MLIGNLLNQLSRVAELVYTVNQRLDRVEADVREVQRGLQEVRLDFVRHESRLAALEEGRNTIKAEVRAIIAETVADLRVRFAEAQAAQSRPSQSSTPLPPSAEPQGGNS